MLPLAGCPGGSGADIDPAVPADFSSGAAPDGAGTGMILVGAVALPVSDFWQPVTSSVVTPRVTVKSAANPPTTTFEHKLRALTIVSPFDVCTARWLSQPGACYFFNKFGSWFDPWIPT